MKYDAREIRALYDRGERVMDWLRARERGDGNSPTAILYSYDAQAGSYVALVEDPSHAERKRAIARNHNELTLSPKVTLSMETIMGCAPGVYPRTADA